MMDVANSTMRILGAAELGSVAGGCPCGGDCQNWTGTLVRPGQAAPANSFYLDSIPSGAIFITPGQCLD